MYQLERRTCGLSVMASLKTKYALNKNGEFTSRGLGNSIIEEIVDELRIKKDIKLFDLKNNLLAAYRDIVECGKPQLLFFASVNLTKDAIDMVFTREAKQIKRRLKKEKWDAYLRQLQDGEHLIRVDKEELKKL